MKKAIITGITGQDGSYLAEFLLEKVNTFRRTKVKEVYTSVISIGV